MAKNKKKKHRHMSREELIFRLNETAKRKTAAYIKPFTGMLTLTTYIMWKEYGWKQVRLARYAKAVEEYEYKIEDREIQLQDLSDRLYEKTGFTIETEKHSVSTTHKHFSDWLENEHIKARDFSLDMAGQHFLVHFNVLMDFGFGSKRLNDGRLYIYKYAQLVDDNVLDITKMREELRDIEGIEIHDPEL